MLIMQRMLRWINLDATRMRFERLFTRINLKLIRIKCIGSWGHKSNTHKIKRIDWYCYITVSKWRGQI